MTAYREPAETADHALAQSIAAALAPSGFVAREIGDRVDAVVVEAAWVRKTWNTNRAVVQLRAPAGASDLGELAQELKMELGRRLKYITFLYGIGLQVVWTGEGVLGRAPRLEASVDAIDNQRCIIQSLFVVDFEARAYRSARTWGQVITGRFQDLIEETLARTFRRR